MSIEVIGMVGTKDVSESRGSFDGPPIDAGYLTRFAQAHEAACLRSAPGPRSRRWNRRSRWSATTV